MEVWVVPIHLHIYILSVETLEMYVVTHLIYILSVQNPKRDQFSFRDHRSCGLT